MDLFALLHRNVFFQERLARIEQDIREEEMRQRQEAKYKREQLDRAERNRNAPVDDSQMVDEMFGFIDAQTDSSGEGAAPTAFKVSSKLFSKQIPFQVIPIKKFFSVCRLIITKQS